MTRKMLTEHTAIKAKLEKAEQHIAVLRLLFSVFSAVIYVLFMDADPRYAQLAWFIIITGNAYSLFSLIVKPHKRWGLFRSSYFITIADGLFTVLWIIATGWMDSPFYLIWYLSIISVAARFSALETAVSSLVYLLLYALIFFYDDGLGIEASHLITRMGFIPLSGILGIYFSNEIMDQISDKLRLIRAEDKLLKVNDELEQRVKEQSCR